MAAANNPLKRVAQGDVFNLRFRLFNKDGTGPASYSNPVAYFALGDKQDIEAGEAADYTNDSSAGTVLVQQEEISNVNWWVVYVPFVSEDTLEGSVQAGVHYYELKIIDGYAAQTVAKGLLDIDETIIRSAPPSGGGAIIYTPSATRTVTNKQIRLWASDNGSPTLYIYLLINGISSLPEDPESVFHTGGDMIEGDALADRIQAILGFTDDQMTAAVTAMLTYPE
jgi:hypothetical protein